MLIKGRSPENPASLGAQLEYDDPRYNYGANDEPDQEDGVRHS